MRAVLFSTYELGRQPFGLASAAAWLERCGAEVAAHDLSQCTFAPDMVEGAGLVGFYVPMHTATRLAEPTIRAARAVAPDAHLVAFGLYGPMNADHLRRLGIDSILGGEFETGLASIHDAVAAGRPAPQRDLGPVRQDLLVPQRAGLPGLDRYARIRLPDGSERVAGSTEATRGCRHRCRHCPIVPVYDGRFVVVDPQVVLADVRAQVRAGAQHVTFGDPDFFNGPAHALRIVRALHDEHPEVTYDVTIKVEHLARRARHLSELVATGCILVTTAVESFDEAILDRFDKRHDRRDFERVLAAARRIGLAINPTFVAFTPWTTRDGYLDFLREVARLGIVDSVAPIQYGIRLLVPAGSRLLDLPEVADLVDPFDDAMLVHPWVHPDPGIDRLQERVMALVSAARERSRREVFEEVWAEAAEAAGRRLPPPRTSEVVPPVTVPYLTEPWYC